MKKIIRCKEELQSLLWDLNAGKESGTDSEVLLSMCYNKIKSIMKLSEADYISMRWE
jgi:hypothetical protein